MTMEKLGALFMLAMLLAMMLTCGAQLSRGATQTHEVASLGITLNDIDPDQTMTGSLVAGEIVADSDGRLGTEIEVHPMFRYALYNETVTFCGNESQKLTVEGTTRFLPGNLLFIYRRAASRLINGVPCFQLRGVYRIVEPKGK